MASSGGRRKLFLVFMLINTVSVTLSHGGSNCRGPPYPYPAVCDRKPHLQMDTASIHLFYGQNDNVGEASKANDISIYAVYDICWKCNFNKLLEIRPNQTSYLFVSSQYGVQLQVHLQNSSAPSGSTVICSYHTTLSEYGEYELHLMASSNEMCNFYAVNSPPDSNIPIYVALAILAALSLLWILIKFLHRKQYLYEVLFCFETERLINTDLGSPSTADGISPSQGASEAPVVPTKTRLRSLDAMRGLSLTIMIFVNYNGGRYWFFSHSRWNGVTVADLVFPWFVFIMGTSIALAFKGLVRRNTPKWQMLLKVVKRTLILFALGLFLNSSGGPVDMTMLRIPGVLQRLAFTYFLVAILEVFFAKHSDAYEFRWFGKVRDIVPFWPEWIIMITFVVVHTCITFLLKVPGCPTGYLGPGGFHDNSSYYNCTGGAAGWIDRWFFGDNHTYSHPTCTKWYFPNNEKVYYDPEGILGTLNSAFLCFLGLQAGKILNMYRDWVQRIVRWMIWCIITGAIAAVLCKVSRDDGWIPLNKNLWSLSFILGLACMAFFLFIVCYLLIDVFKLWTGAPFVYPGMNSILIYMGHEIFQNYFPIKWKVPSDHASLLALHLWGTAFWVIVSYILYRKKIFVAI